MSKIGQASPAARLETPDYYLGSTVGNDLNGILRYARALSAITKGQLAAPRIYETITTGIVAAADTKTFDSTDSSFTVRVTAADNSVTTYEAPAIGSLLHVTTGTGVEQFARVVEVETATRLIVDVIGRTDGTWETALGATDTVVIIEPALAPYDSASHTLRPFGYAIEAVAAGAYGFFGAVGQFPCIPNSTAVGTRLTVGTTAGQVEPTEIYATATWDAGIISDGDEEAKTVTVTGAAVADFVNASLTTLLTDDLSLTATVEAANTVKALLANNTGSDVNLTEGTLYVRVDKRISLPNYDCGLLVSAPGTAGELGIVEVNFLPSIQGNWFF